MKPRMPNIVDFPDRESIELEAASWVVRRDAGGFGPEEEAAFAAWLRSSERHREAWQRLSALWDDAAVLEELGVIADSVRERDLQSSPRRPRRASLLATAASIVAVLLAVLLLVDPAPLQPPGVQDYVTAIGEQRTVDLADGSVVRLNTDTVITVGLSRDSRRIRLLQGEAFFEVAHDPDRPFTVDSPVGSVRAIGTSFSARLRGRKLLEVTVAEGRVEVAPAPAASGAATPAPGRVRRVEVPAGSTATWSETTGRVESVSQSELERTLSWREGVVVFAGEPLSAVIKEVSRYTDVEIRIADESIETLPIGGYFRVGEIEGLLESLELVFGVRAHHSASGEIVLARAE